MIASKVYFAILILILTTIGASMIGYGEKVTDGMKDIRYHQIIREDAILGIRG